MNISELARHLDLAVSTVSRVLSGSAEKYRISARTVRRVREAAERYQVAPDPLGAGLRRGSLGMVGLLVPDITNPFFSQLARAIELNFRHDDIAVQLCDSAEDAATERHLLRTLLSRRLDGLILAPVGRETEELAEAIRGSAMPLVLIDRPLPDLDLPGIHLDNFEAGRLAAGRLLESGHRRLGCLRGDSASRADQERLAGARRAVEDAGLARDELVVTGSGYSREASLAAARELLDRTSPPTGVLTLSGQGILGVLEVGREMGLRLPDDLSVVAFDEQPWSALVSPPLTTITQPVEAMAEAAVALLRGRIDGDSHANGSQVFRAHLCVRESVAPPR